MNSWTKLIVLIVNLISYHLKNLPISFPEPVHSSLKLLCFWGFLKKCICKLKIWGLNNEHIWRKTTILDKFLEDKCHFLVRFIVSTLPSPLLPHNWESWWMVWKIFSLSMEAISFKILPPMTWNFAISIISKCWRFGSVTLTVRHPFCHRPKCKYTCRWTAHDWIEN